MSDQASVEALIDIIKAHSDELDEAVSQFETFCLQSEQNGTPLNTAIECNNVAAISHLVEEADAVNFSPELDDDLVTPIRHLLAQIMDEDDITSVERHLSSSYGPRLCLQRSPLHQACRSDNKEAVALLIERNADLGAKDLLGLTPFELCMEFGGESLVDRFLMSCKAAEVSFELGELQLKKLCYNKALFEAALEVAKMDAKTGRFAFCYACALLDKGIAQNLLDKGLDINKTTSREVSPVLEACTSALINTCGRPPEPRVSKSDNDAAALGSLISDFSNALEQSGSLEDFEAMMAAEEKEYASHAERKRAERRAQRRAKSKAKKAAAFSVLGEATDAERLEQRLAFIDWLVEQGLNPKRAVKNAPSGFIRDVGNTGQPGLLKALEDHGFVPGTGDEKEQDRDKAQSASTESKVSDSAAKTKAIRDPHWHCEYVGESVLSGITDPEAPRAGKFVTVRLTHSNVYGPVDNVQVFARVGDSDSPCVFDDLESGGEWSPMSLVEELLNVDGKEVARSSVTEPIYDETPWDGTYECELTFEKGRQGIEIKLLSEVEGMTGVLSGWTIEVT